MNIKLKTKLNTKANRSTLINLRKRLGDIDCGVFTTKYRRAERMLYTLSFNINNYIPHPNYDVAIAKRN